MTTKTETSTGMNAMEFWRHVGRDEAMKFCARVGMSYDYFKHICHDRKRPSPERAQRMVDESSGLLSFERLLKPRA